MMMRKKALEAAKKFENAKYFSDEFIVAILFARKFDLARTEEFINNSIAWRKEQGFLKLPRFADIDKRNFEVCFYLPGARDNQGRSIRFLRLAKAIPGDSHQSVEELTKWATWLHYVGIFFDGIDGLRNGCTVVADLDGFGWKNFDIDTQRKTSELWLGRFPLLNRKMIIMSAPLMFSACTRIMSTWTKNKIMQRIEPASKKEILKFISADQLPIEFGGTVKFDHTDCIKLLSEWVEKNEDRLVSPGSELAT